MGRSTELHAPTAAREVGHGVRGGRSGARRTHLRGSGRGEAAIQEQQMVRRYGEAAHRVMQLEQRRGASSQPVLDNDDPCDAVTAKYKISRHQRCHPHQLSGLDGAVPRLIPRLGAALPHTKAEREGGLGVGRGIEEAASLRVVAEARGICTCVRIRCTEVDIPRIRSAAAVVFRG